MNKLASNIKLQESELKQIISVRDDQKGQLHQQIDGLISSIQEKEDKINTLEQQLEQTGVDEDTIQSNEGRQASMSDELVSRLGPDFEAFINLIGMNSDQKLSMYASDLVFAISGVKQQLDARIGVNKTLDIDMSKEEDKKFVKLLKYIKLPYLRNIQLEKLGEKEEDIVELMTNSFPYILGGLNFIPTLKERISADYYMEGLAKCLPSVNGQTLINGLTVKSSQFNTLIKSLHNSRTVYITNFLIYKDELYDFCISQPYKIAVLCLHLIRQRVGNLLLDDREQFQEILHCISRSGLKDSLKKMVITGCDITAEELQAFAKTFEIDHIQILDN